MVEDGVGEVAVPVVDDQLRTQATAAVHFFPGSGGGDNAASRFAGELNGGGADAAGAAVNEDGLSRFQIRLRARGSSSAVGGLPMTKAAIGGDQPVHHGIGNAGMLVRSEDGPQLGPPGTGVSQQVTCRRPAEDKRAPSRVVGQGRVIGEHRVIAPHEPDRGRHGRRSRTEIQHLRVELLLQLRVRSVQPVGMIGQEARTGQFS